MWSRLLELAVHAPGPGAQPVITLMLGILTVTDMEIMDMVLITGTRIKHDRGQLEPNPRKLKRVRDLSLLRNERQLEELIASDTDFKIAAGRRFSHMVQFARLSTFPRHAP